MITKHAEKRIRKRLGLNKRIVGDHFAKVIAEGQRPLEFRGSFRRYLDKKAIEYGSSPIVHHGVIYFMKNGALITAYQVPQHYRKYLKNKPNNILAKA